MAKPVDLRAVNLNLMPALEALMSERQVSRAAKRAGVSQSAMSHALAKLRVLLDDPLLVPSGRRMTPTPRGEHIAAALPAALEALGAIIAPPAPFDPRTDAHAFTLATLDYFEVTTLAHMLGVLDREAPHVRLDVERADSDAVERLRAGAIDLLVTGVSARLPSSGLRSRHLFDDPFAVIVRQGHPLAKGRFTLKRYAEASHLVVSVDRRSHGVVDRVLREHGYTRHIALRVPHFLSAPLAVAETDLVCTVAGSVAQRGKELFGLKVLRPPIAIPPAGVMAWWPRRHDDDSARAWFRDIIFSGRALSPTLRRLLEAQQRAAC